MWVLILSVFVVFSTLSISSEIVSTADGQGGDTWLNYYNQGGNYGEEESFLISKDHVPYIKLDFSDFNNVLINDANLILYTDPCDNALPTYDYSFAIFGVLDGFDAWDELNLKYNNAPVITNPVTWHPLLRYLGRVNYSKSAPGDFVVMEHTGEVPLVDFINNRGPDNQVSLIIASGAVTEQRFFSTKEHNGDGLEAPFISFESDPTLTEFNNWTGSESNDWNDAFNWTDESDVSSIPDSNSIVNISGQSNVPVIVSSDAWARKLFVDSGGLKVESGKLTVTDGVLRIKDGVKVDITEGEIALAGNFEGQMWGMIGDDRIITSNPCVQEVYAEVVDVNENNNISEWTWIKTREKERRLTWGNSIVDANGVLGRAVDPYPPQARAAHYCVDRSGMVGPEVHIGSIGGGSTVPGNYYYAYNMAFEEPSVKFSFDDTYNLTEMLVWNYELNYAFNKVQIEYSTDDINYTILKNGMDDYFYLDYGNKLGTKNDVIDFEGAPAKYVKITAVGGPGVGNHEMGTTWGRYILRELQFRHEGKKACEPYPANNDSAVNTDFGNLIWIPGRNATVGQNVWFGTSAESMALIGDEIDVCQGSISIPAGIEITSNTHFYWRVDAVTESGSEEGRLWTFTTRPYLSYNPGGEGVVYAFGIKTSGGSKGYLAANGSGLNGDIRTSTNDTTMWYCANPAGVGITEPELYIELDKIYDLDEIWVWNYPSNGSDPVSAWKTIEIRYSTDGYNYEQLMNGSGSTFVLAQGNPDGTHDTEIPFGVPARYVRIKAIGGSGTGNYGSANYRLCEVRFYANGEYSSAKAFDPSPGNNFEVDIFTELNWKPGTAAVTGQDLWFGPSGSMLKIADDIGPEVSSYSFDRPLDNNASYEWRVDSRDINSVTTGEVWGFDTKARLGFNPVVIGIVNAESSPSDDGSEGFWAVNQSGLNYDYHYTHEYYGELINGWYARKPWNVGVTEPTLVVEFDRPYVLNEMWVWNHDGMDNTNNDHEYNIAVKDIKVEYSVDGENYSTLGSTYTLPHGDPEGWHDTVIDFGGVSAKFVRITLLSNYGSTSWGYKLREFRFYYEVPLWSDVNNSETVDYNDYSVIASDWLEDNWTGVEPIPCPGKPDGDVNGDCKVDATDIEWLALEWLDYIN